MFKLFRNKDKYQYSENLVLQLIELINKVKSYISDDSNMTYCYYDTPSDLINALDGFIKELEKRNMNIIDDLAVEFAPTSSLQEHSICNGWSKEYLKIASEFDFIQYRAKQ